MSENLLRELQHSADMALKCQSVEEGVRHLSKAFALFSEEATRLKSAYAKLQERFDVVNVELNTKVAELNRLSRFLHNLLKHMSDAILFIDLNGTLALINEAALKLLGFKAEEVLFKKFWDLFSDDCFGFPMRESLQFGISHKFLYKNYPPKELEVTTTFVHEGPKAYQGLIVILRDVSEKLHMQRINSRNDRMKELGEMAASLAHEIRNPLGGIRGYASLLSRDLADEPLQEMVLAIIEGTKALDRLVSSVLQYARPLQLEFRSVEMGQFLRQIVRFVKVDPSSPSNVQWILHIPEDPLLAPIDPNAMKSTLLNLIFNGLQAMPQGGTLTLSLLKLDHCYQISLSDTGVGMDDEMLGRLFSPFFTTKEQGNGLGLVETQKVIQAHAGAIDVRSRLGKGSTFTITLPLRRS